MKDDFDRSRFLHGKGVFIDDIELHDMLHARIVRSTYAQANIIKIHTDKAKAIPGVKAILTAKNLQSLGLACFPTLAGDKQPILADKKVCMYGQEIAVVIATTPAIAEDAIDSIEVEYEPLPVISDPHESLEPEAIIIRSECCVMDDIGQGERLHPNHIFHWTVGQEDATQDAFDTAECVIKQQMHYPRLHPCPLETCGCIADFNSESETLEVHVSSQLPNSFCLTLSTLLNLPENDIRMIPGDMGGNFGNKASIYPAYILTVVASMLLKRPVKWIESRSENFLTTAWAGDYWLSGELAADRNGNILAMRARVLADHGAFNAQSQPSQWPTGFLGICTSLYNIPVAFLTVDGVFTNKSPGGIAYRSAFRSSEAIYLIERLIDILSQKLHLDKVQVRAKNFIHKSQMPYRTALGWTIDSGNYQMALARALKKVNYDYLVQKQKALREQGKFMGIGVAAFTYPTGAGPVHICDSFGIDMCDRAELHVLPTGDLVAKVSTLSEGQHHIDAYISLIEHELGIDKHRINIKENNTLAEPYSASFQGGRAISVASSACVLAARKIKKKAKMIAAKLLEVPEEILEWHEDRFIIKGLPSKSKTLTELAWSAYHHVPDGIDPGLEAVEYYKPKNFTFPFGIYICTVNIDACIGRVEVDNFYALNDCGKRIDPLVADGQIYAGLFEGLAVTTGQALHHSETGKLLNTELNEYFWPTPLAIPQWHIDFTETASPLTPIGAKSFAEAAHIGSIPCLSSAVIDAFSHLGVLHLDMPHTPQRLWQKMHSMGVNQ